MVDEVRRVHAPTAILALSGLLLASVMVALTVGPYRLEISQLFAASLPGAAESPEALILRELRLPRIVLAMLVGAALAVSGAILQGLFRNPLADPGLIGVSSGAALGAVAVIVIGERVFSGLGMSVPALALPLTAFAGALLTTMLIWGIARRQGGTSVALLLLAGIAVNAIAGAATGLLTYMADDAQLRSLTFWSMGSLAHADWADIRLALPFLLLVLFVAPRLARPLNALLLGEAVAGHLGFETHRLKQVAVVVAALAVGAAVAVSGLIGFVGLVAPHLVRLVVGVDHRWLLPGSALLGALLLVVADALARVVVQPAELPIGLMMALLGGPFFLFLLTRVRVG